MLHFSRPFSITLDTNHYNSQIRHHPCSVDQLPEDVCSHQASVVRLACVACAPMPCDVYSCTFGGHPILRACAHTTSDTTTHCCLVAWRHIPRTRSTNQLLFHPAPPHLLYNPILATTYCQACVTRPYFAMLAVPPFITTAFC